MSQDIVLCPTCKKGHLRPIDLPVDYSGDGRDEGHGMRDYQCDNNECKHKELSR
jgi:hypothetical protein